jgi:D-alanine-D-alanine ligase
LKKLRVLVLMHEELVPPESLEGMSEREIMQIAMEYDVRHALRELGHEIQVLGVKDELGPIRTAIREWQPHITFNLLMHFRGIGVYDAYVVSYLELLRCPYTGCNPRGLMLCNDKVLAKKILGWHRILTPRFAVFPRSQRVSLPARLSFPLFVKSAAEHSSLGIAQASVVHDEAALRERVAFVHRTVGTDAIAEEYIEGRELTISVMGNQRLQAFPIWELTFQNLPEGAAAIATSKLKWDVDYQARVGARSAPARRLPEGKPEEITRLAKRIYRALGLSGFARIDMRLTEEGRIYVLEANPNPDLCHDEDFAQSAKLASVAYEALIQRLLNLGLRWSAAWRE